MDIIDFILVCMIAVPVIIVIALVSLIVYGVIKKKRKITVASASILISSVVLIGGFMFLFPTEFPYVDKLLYGKTKDEVINIYGEPEINSERRIGYYIGEDNRGIDPSHLDIYYYVYFDEKGVVNEIYCGVQPGG